MSLVYARDVCDLIPSLVSPSMPETHCLDEPSMAPDTIVGLRVLCETYSTAITLHASIVLLVGLVYGDVGEHMSRRIYCEVAMQKLLVHKL